MNYKTEYLYTVFTNAQNMQPVFLLLFNREWREDVQQIVMTRSRTLGLTATMHVACVYAAKPTWQNHFNAWYFWLLKESRVRFLLINTTYAC